jgi:hypothetical protein
MSEQTVRIKNKIAPRTQDTTHAHMPLPLRRSRRDDNRTKPNRTERIKAARVGHPLALFAKGLLCGVFSFQHRKLYFSVTFRRLFFEKNLNRKSNKNEQPHKAVMQQASVLDMTPNQLLWCVLLVALAQLKSQFQFELFVSSNAHHTMHHTHSIKGVMPLMVQ